MYPKQLQTKVGRRSMAMGGLRKKPFLSVGTIFRRNSCGRKCTEITSKLPCAFSRKRYAAAAEDKERMGSSAMLWCVGERGKSGVKEKWPTDSSTATLFGKTWYIIGLQ